MKKFIKIIIENQDIKPYYSIQFIGEDGEDYIGYGSYSIDVISRYLRQYFFRDIEEPSNTAEFAEYHSISNTI